MASERGLGAELEGRIQSVLHDLMQVGDTGSLSEVEREIRKGLLEAGRLLLELRLAALEPAYPKETIDCACGGRAKYQCRREGVLQTTVGTVHYKRAYYLCPQCHRGHFPLDEQLGLRPGEMSAELESLLAMTGAQVPFAKGVDLFERLTLVHVSPQSMDKATEVMGQEVAAREREWQIASHDVARIESQQQKRRTGKRLYGTLDAVKYHSREHRDEDDNGWRELKVGVWFTTKAEPPKISDGVWDIEAEDISYYCDTTEAETFGQLVWATGFQREALCASEVVFIGDGADWIWNLVGEHFPEAVQIVDWFHAAEHLGTVAKAAFSDEREQKAWLEEAKDRLWAGEVDTVIRLLNDLTADRDISEATKAVHYFDKHRQRMDYASFRNKGYHIGSGTVESACKQLGIQRMKVPGASWSLTGACGTAKARATLLSNQWDELAARRERLPRAA